MDGEEMGLAKRERSRTVLMLKLWATRLSSRRLELISMESRGKPCKRRNRKRTRAGNEPSRLDNFEPQPTPPFIPNLLLDPVTDPPRFDKSKDVLLLLLIQHSNHQFLQPSRPQQLLLSIQLVFRVRPQGLVHVRPNPTSVPFPTKIPGNSHFPVLFVGA